MSNSHHVISYSEAVDFILDFVIKYPDAASRSLGGYMDKTTVNAILEENGRVDLYGLLCWYCFNEEIEELPYFFLSFTNMEDFDPGNPPTEVADTDYFAPSSVHAYTGEATENAVSDYLENTDFSQSGNADSLTRSTVVALNTGYMQDFPPADDNEDYRGGPGGFFVQEDTGIKELISAETCIGFNYFFGITDDNLKKICIVLFPVNNTGVNVINGLIMERSWPL
jgi:hypothetical protein